MAPCDDGDSTGARTGGWIGGALEGRPMGSRGVVGRRAAFGAVTALVVSGGLTVTVGPAYADHSVVELVTTSAAAGNGPFDADPVGATDDGSRVFFETDEPMVASDTGTEQDVYERTGGVTTLSPPVRATRRRPRPSPASGRRPRTAPTSSSRLPSSWRHLLHP